MSTILFFLHFKISTLILPVLVISLLPCFYFHFIRFSFVIPFTLVLHTLSSLSLYSSLSLFNNFSKYIIHSSSIIVWSLVLRCDLDEAAFLSTRISPTLVNTNLLFTLAHTFSHSSFFIYFFHNLNTFYLIYCIDL